VFLAGKFLFTSSDTFVVGLGWFSYKMQTQKRTAEITSQYWVHRQ